MRNFAYAVKAMNRNRVFAGVAVLVLALGIGATTACFSVIQAVLLRPLSYPNPDQLVILSGGATPVRFALMKSAARSFTGMGAYAGQETLTLTGGTHPEALKAARVSASFSKVLGVAPVLGRGFLETEDKPAGAPIALVSADFWKTHFAGDLHVIGKSINLAGRPYTIVGVLPNRFDFPFPGLAVWLAQPSEWPEIAPTSRALSPFLTIFGRLKPEITTRQANAEAQLLQRRYAEGYPAMLDAKPKFPLQINPFKEQVVGSVRSELWMMFGAVSFVLLIACANLASLLLAQAHARSREFAIRAALGAGRTHLLAQQLTESLLLSVVGGGIGLLLAVASLQVLPALTLWTLPRTDEIHLDGTVLGFAAMLCCSTGFLIGLLPALTASRLDLTTVLRARKNASKHGWKEHLASPGSARGVLVAGQIALCTVLLIGASLLIESVLRLRGESLGFDPANLLTARISLPPQRYDTDPKKTAFFEQLLDRVRGQPGIQSAALAMTLPMTGFAGTPVQDADKPRLLLNQRPIATILVVSPDYFATLKIPVERGRAFTARERESSPRVAVIDEGLARRFWPAYPRGEDPIGHRLVIGGTSAAPVQIVGVVANVHQNIENSAWPESVYVAFSQNALPSAFLSVRVAADPFRVAPALRESLRQLDRDQPLSELQTMEALVEAQLGERRLLTLLLGSFASVATLLAVVGIYGVASYAVVERTQEIGVRRALGAPETDILWLIIRQALSLALIGSLFGLGGAFALTRLLKGLLFHISAADPTTMASVATLFLLVALAASYLPARRATDVNPMVALRYE